MKKKTKKIPENELPLRTGEAVAELLRRIDEEIAVQKLTKEWQDELIDKVAQCLHRRNWLRLRPTVADAKMWPWRTLDKGAKQYYRQSARAALKTVARFVEKKRRTTCKD